jgi:phage FluMu protein Com
VPLRIRCPHCHKVLLVADEEAGQSKTCPECAERFSVPLPRAATETVSAARVAMPKCPRCDTELVATATYCHRCHTDLQTGKRLPFKRRLRLFSWRIWTATTLIAAIVVIGGVVGWRMHRLRTAPVAPTFEPTAPAALPLQQLASDLLAARDDAARGTALTQLAGVEVRVAPTIAAALAAALDQSGGDWPTWQSQIAAIDLLARQGSAHAGLVPNWIEVLQRATARDALRPAALRARALLGDTTAIDPLVTLWQSQLADLLSLRHIARVAESEDDPAMVQSIDAAQRALQRSADGLQALAEIDPLPVFEPLAAEYWTTWHWLGQEQGNRYADALFNLARPAGQTLTFRPEDVRGPRDLMGQLARSASPAAAAAAGMVLEQRGPQYRTMCRRVADLLAQALPDCDAANQQRLTWAISRLLGRLFGPAARATPLDVTARDIAAALAWAHPGAALEPAAPLPHPPHVVYRAVTAARRVEADLLRELAGNWSRVSPIVDRWRAADLGCTPGITALLNPGQRRPDYPSVVAAMIIAADCAPDTCQRELTLWRDAPDQPPAIRALAYTVLGAHDARRGAWESGWPAGLDLGPLGVLDAGRPGWDHFGRVLATGGHEMLTRLTEQRPDAISAATLARLRAATRAVAGPPRDED